MKKLYSLMAMVMVMLVAGLVAGVMPFVMATDTGIGVGISAGASEFSPLIWMCDNRVLIDDELEPGRVNGPIVCAQKYEPDACEQNPNDRCSWQTTTGQCIFKGYDLVERHNNYAFEGEKLEWKVLVMDKNKIEEIQDVVATVGMVQDSGNEFEVECVELHGFATYGDDLLDSCNMRIGQKDDYVFDDQIMAYYECTLTVETSESMYGEYWITVQANSANDAENNAVMDENEYFFLNPVIALTVTGSVDFGNVEPGTVSYSDTILVGNDADVGSGVTLDMFISGTDFYDSTSTSGARCVITNRLKLGDNRVVSGDGNANNKCEIGFGDTDDHFCYFATNGGYSTTTDPRSDVEGYAPIVYGNYFNTDFYNDAEILQANQMGAYWGANMLVPGSEMALTFKLGLPEPCVGTFTDGKIYFWGEAI